MCLIASSLIVSLWVIFVVERAQATVPECLEIDHQKCPLFESNTILALLAVFGIVVPMAGILLVLKGAKVIGKKQSHQL